jgi:hypothetical protein
MEAKDKYKLLKRYKSTREIVVVSSENDDKIGCELDPNLGEKWINDKKLIFGPNIAFFKSTGTSNPGLFSAKSLPDNLKKYYERYQTLKSHVNDDPNHPEYNEYLNFENALRNIMNSIKSIIDTDDNAILTLYEGIYFPFLSCFKGRYEKMNSVTIPTTGESICDFLPSSITTLRSRFFINSYFNCYSELRISAALGGNLWETEFKDLRNFLLNNKKINTRCSHDFEKDKILPIDVEGSSIVVEDLDYQDINKMLISNNCLRENKVDVDETIKSGNKGGKRKETKRKKTKRKRNRQKSIKNKKLNK